MSKVHIRPGGKGRRTTSETLLYADDLGARESGGTINLV